MGNLMKTFILLTFVAISSTVQAERIRFFRGTWQNAMDRAKAENKVLFVHAYRKPCKPCNEMLRSIYVQDRIGSFFNENFINFELDMESMNGKNFGVLYPAYQSLTLFFLSPTGEVLMRLEDMQQPVAFLEFAKEAFITYHSTVDYEERYWEGDNEFYVVYNYMKLLIERGEPHLEVAQEYLRGKPSITKEQRNLFVFAAASDFEGRYFKKVVDKKEAMVKLVGQETFDTKVKNIVLSTIDKAIESNNQDVLNSAIELAKANLTTDFAMIEYMAKTRYALSTNNPVDFVKFAELWIEHTDYDEGLVEEIIQAINNNFDQNIPAVQLGVNLVESRLAIGDPAGYSIGLYTKILTLGNRKEDALVLIEKLIKKYKVDQLQVLRLRGVKKYIDNLEPLQA
jgi:hypothetical protein